MTFEITSYFYYLKRKHTLPVFQFCGLPLQPARKLHQPCQTPKQPRMDAVHKWSSYHFEYVEKQMHSSFLLLGLTKATTLKILANPLQTLASTSNINVTMPSQYVSNCVATL